MAWCDPDGAGQAGLVIIQALLSLEAGEVCPAFSPIADSPFQVSESFLGGAFGDFYPPGGVFPFPAVPLLVELDGGGGGGLAPKLPSGGPGPSCRRSVRPRCAWPRPCGPFGLGPAQSGKLALLSFGHHFNLCPVLFLGKGLKALNLPFQILSLVGGGHSGIEHSDTFWARHFHQNCPGRQLAGRDGELAYPKPSPGGNIAYPLLASPIREFHG
jgi:hypothetical protein